MSAAKQPELLRAGTPAPDFTLKRLGEGEISLKSLLVEGPVLLAFFKTSCPVCQMTLPFLDRIEQGRAPGSYAVYGVSQDDAETTQEFNQAFGVKLPMLLDSDESGYPASNAYGLSHVPSMFLVNPDGHIAWSLEGFVKRELESIAKEAGVEVFRQGDNVPEWKAG